MWIYLMVNEGLWNRILTLKQYYQLITVSNVFLHKNLTNKQQNSTLI